MAIKISGSTIIDDSRVLINTGNVGVGTTNPNSVVSVSNTSIVHAGIVTAYKLYGDGSSLTNLPGGGGGAPGASTVDITANSSDASQFVTFVASGAGNRQILVDGGLRYNPSSNTLTATTFSGNLPTTDLTGTITNAQLAGSIADDKLASTFLKNVVEDTTPQLGGNLDVNSKDITGTGNVNLTGIVTATSFVGNGSGLTNLNVPGISTSGTTTFTNLNVTGVSTFAGDVKYTSATTGLGVFYDRSADTLKLLEDGSDNTKLTLGDNSSYSSYMQIYHDGGNSGTGYINYAGSNKMVLSGNNISFFNTTRSEVMLEAVQNNGVFLYYDNVQKFQTTSTGVIVNGVVTATTFSGSGTSLTNVDAATLDSLDSTSFLRSDAADLATGQIRINTGTANPLELQRTSQVGIEFNDTSTGSRYLGVNSGTLYYGTNLNHSINNKVWHEGNDGSGSGLDADLLDGQEGSYYTNASNLGSGTVPDAIFPATLPAVSGANLTNLPAATTITVADESSDSACFPVFTTAATGNQAPKTHASALYYNSTNGTLHATSFSGTLLTAAQTNITTIGTLVNLTVSGNITANGNIVGDNSTDISGIDQVTANTFSGSGANLTALTGASAATYGDGSNVAQIVVDSNGRITGISNVSISGGGGATDKIEEGNTSAEVVDTGSDGHFKVLTEGTERFRIGPAGIATFNNDLRVIGNLYLDSTKYLSAGGSGGSFGSVQINGDGGGGYEGYSIDGRAAFVHDGSTTLGLYDDVNDHWALQHSMQATDSFTTLYSGNNTERLRIGPNGQLGLSGANYGTSGQVLTSGGASGAVSWTTVSSGGATDKIEEGNTSAEVIDTGSDGRFVVKTEGSERLRITSAGKVGIGTTNPSHPLHIYPVEGTNGIAFDTVSNVGTGKSSLSTVTETRIFSASKTVFRSVELSVQATEGTNYHFTKIHLIHDGTNVYMTEYGTIFNNSPVATFNSDINNNNLRLLATSASSNQTDYHMHIVGIKV